MFNSIAGFLIELFFVTALLSLLRSKVSLKATVVLAPLIIGVSAFLYVETLSLFDLVSRQLLLVPIVATILGALAFRNSFSNGLTALGSDTKKFVSILTGRIHNFSDYLLAFASIVSILAIVCVTSISLLGPPNNWDSNTYHLPRVMHWLQNENVGFYDTNVRRQLVSPPLGGYLLLFTMALSGSDRLVNTVQLGAFFFSIIVTLVIGRAVTNSSLSLKVLLPLSVGIPIALAEAATTQVDLISTIWVLCGVAAVINYGVKVWNFTFTIIVFSSTALLAAATKPTALVALLPVGIWFLILIFSDIRRVTISNIWKVFVALTAAITGVIIGFLPQVIRTYNNSGIFIDLGGGITSAKLVVSRIGLDITTSNIARFVVGNFGAPDFLKDIFPVQGVNHYLNLFLQKLLVMFGINWTDSDATSFGIPATFGYWANEDRAGNPIQIVFGIFAVFILIIAQRKLKLSRMQIQFTLVVAFIFIAVASIFTWNIWINRFIIPVLFLFSVVIGLLFSKLVVLKKTFTKLSVISISALIALNSALSLSTVLFAENRPIFPLSEFVTKSRQERVFYKMSPKFKESYLAAIDQLNQLPDGTIVGLNFGQESYEYQIWELANSNHRLIFKVFPKQIFSESEVPAGMDAVFCLPGCDFNNFPNIKLINVTE